MTTPDARLTPSGPLLSTVELLDVWAEHCPPFTPLPEACLACGHVYSPSALCCPTGAVIGKVLRRRQRGQRPVDLRRLTFAQEQDLLDARLLNRELAVARRHWNQSGLGGESPTQLDLLDLVPIPDRTPGRTTHR